MSMKPSGIRDILAVAAAVDGPCPGTGSISGRGADAQGAGMTEHMATTRSVDAKPAVRSGPEG